MGLNLGYLLKSSLLLTLPKNLLFYLVVYIMIFKNYGLLLDTLYYCYRLESRVSPFLFSHIL